MPEKIQSKSFTEEVVIGYIVQLVSVLLMLAQHFVLPVFLGLEEYGRLAFTIGMASLLFSAFDYGYNLLTVRRPHLSWHYLSAKLALLACASLVFIFYALTSSEVEPEIIFPVLVYGFSYITYTYFVNCEIAHGRIKRVVYFSIISGSLLLINPLLFHYSDTNIMYAPATTMVVSVVVVIFLSRRESDLAGWKQIIKKKLRGNHLKKSAIKQAQISFGTIIEALIIWLGIVLVSIYEGFEAAAIYRIVMSALSLMAQLLPVPKQVLIRLAKTRSDYTWSIKYLLMIMFIGALQVLVVYLLAEMVIGLVFPDKVNIIYAGILIMAPAAALKATFELETVLFDRDNKLSFLFWFGLIAIIPTIGGFVFFGVYWAVLIFYTTLCFVSTIVLFSLPRTKIQADEKQFL